MSTKKEPVWVTEGVPFVQLVCVGQRIATDKKLAWFFTRRDDLDGPQLGYNAIKGGWPGRVFEVAMKEDGTYWPASLRYVESLKDERVAQWDLDHRAAQTAEGMRLREAKDKREANPLGERTLEQLRLALNDAPYPQRAALMGQVYAYLQR